MKRLQKVLHRQLSHPFPPPLRCPMPLLCRQECFMLALIICQNIEIKHPLSKGTLLNNLLQGVTFCNSLVLADKMEKHEVKGPKL